MVDGALAATVVLSLAPTAVLAFALLIGLLKGRYLITAVAAVCAAVLALVADAALGTLNAGAVPIGDAWILVLVMFAAWPPALAAATGEASEDSVWARSGRARAAAPLADVAANFVWVFAILLLGVLFDGAGIIGGEAFCAAFALLLAAVLLFGLGAPRAKAA